jgi:hypothetical protein
MTKEKEQKPTPKKKKRKELCPGCDGGPHCAHRAED